MITPRSEDYSAWYSDVISAADMADQSSVRGCMVIKPWGMAIWDLLRSELDQKIKDSGTQNAYFPLFIPKSFLSKEAEHVDGFAKECAVVTHHRLCMSPDGKELIPGMYMYVYLYVCMCIYIYIYIYICFICVFILIFLNYINLVIDKCLELEQCCISTYLLLYFLLFYE